MGSSSILLRAVMAASLVAYASPTWSEPAKVAADAPASVPAATSGPAQAAAAKKPDDPNQTVCLREEVTGSRLAPMKCHTRAEWAQRRANGDEQLQLLGAGPNAGAMRHNGE
jgi:cytochrome c5